MLYAYNKTLGALPLPTASPVVTLPIATAAPSLGARGEAFDVTDELSGLTAPQYADIQLRVAAGEVELEWSTGIPEFNTYTLVVGQAAEEFAENDVAKFADPAGLDSNPGTQTQPVLSYKKTLNLIPGAWRRSGLAFFGAGTYAYAELTNNKGISNPIGLDASPLALVGAYSTLASFTSAGVPLTDGIITTTATIPPLATGTATAFAVAASIVTLSGSFAAAITAGLKAGMSITQVGSTSPGNNGTFLLISVAAGALTYINTAAVAEAYAGAWDITVDRYYGVPRMIVVGGAGVGQARGCAGNTANTLTPSQPFNGIDGTSVIELQTCSTVFSLTTIYNLAMSKLVGYKGIKFQGSSALFGDFAQATFEGCIMELTGTFFLLRHARARSPFNFFEWAPLGANNPFSNALRPFGVFFDMSPAVNPFNVLNVNVFQHAGLEGSHLFRNTMLGAQYFGHVGMSGVHGRNTSTLAVNGGQAFLNPSAFFGAPPFPRTTWKGKHPNWTSFGTATSNAMFQMDRAQITDVGGTQAIFQLGGDTPAPPAFGFENSGARLSLGDITGLANNLPVAVRAMRGSRVTIDANGVPTTLSSLGGDLKFQDPADIRTFASVRVPDANGVKAYVDPYGNAVETF